MAFFLNENNKCYYFVTTDSGSMPEPWIWKKLGVFKGKGLVMGADGIVFEPNHKACNASFMSKCPCKVWTQKKTQVYYNKHEQKQVMCVCFFQRGEEQFDWVWIRAFFCTWVCCASSLPFISSSGITGSSDQFLLMLFCCHGYQVLQYAPLVLLVQNSSLHTHRHYCSRPLPLRVMKQEFKELTKQKSPKYGSH